MRKSSIERDILKSAGYGMLLAFGLGATALFYGVLMASAGELAIASGSTAADTATFGIWATAAAMFLMTAPMLRFLVTELPDRFVESVRIPRVKLRWMGLFAIGLVLLAM